LQCQEALTDSFTTAAASAIAAGWHPEEVAADLVELADNYMLSVLANRDLVRITMPAGDPISELHDRQLVVLDPVA
jgi:putative SOS response-associated peptidase YedK